MTPNPSHVLSSRSKSTVALKGPAKGKGAWECWAAARSSARVAGGARVPRGILRVSGGGRSGRRVLLLVVVVVAVVCCWWWWRWDELPRVRVQGGLSTESKVALGECVAQAATGTAVRYTLAPRSFWDQPLATTI